MSGRLGPQPVDVGAVYVVSCTEQLTADTISGDEELVAVLWPGDAEPIAAEIAASWHSVTATPPEIAIAVEADAVGDLDPGVYQLRVVATLEDGDRLAYLGQLQLVAAPGTEDATEWTSYCAAEDLRRLAPWIEDLASSDAQAGYAEARYQARQWLDQMIASRSRLDAKTIWDYLDADALVVRQWVIDATAQRALAILLRPQLGGRDKTGYQDLADRYEQAAYHAAASQDAELDADDDGVTDIYIPLCVLPVRRG